MKRSGCPLSAWRALVLAGLLRCVSTAATRVMNTRRQARMVQRRWAHAGAAIKWHAQATVDP
ncbi:hypothetical protein NX09_19000 [Xanthomonas vasicola]|nr:hypothetical protein NX09_19000 [Xanthomonas vasicola]